MAKGLDSKEGNLLKLMHGRLQSQHDLLQSVRSLTIHYPLSDDTLLLTATMLSPLLEELHVFDARHITDECFRHLPRRYPHLKSLSLCSASITNTSLVALGQHCHRLKNITLVECRNLPASLFASLTTCPLASVHIDHYLIEAFHDFLFDDGNDEDAHVGAACVLVYDLARFDRLTSLNLGAAFRGVCEFLTSNGGSTWPNLTHFYLHHTTSIIYDFEIIDFLLEHPHLTHLELTHNNFDNDVLEATADFLPQLTYLDLSHGHGRFLLDSVHFVIHKCPLLTFFNLSHCSTIKRADFPELGLTNDALDLNRKEIEIIRSTSDYKDYDDDGNSDDDGNVKNG
ncbi:unnamed protein product [Absidia cylindrospora]